MFNISDIWRMIDLIKLNHTVFIGTQLGLEYLSDFDKTILIANGIDPDDLSLQMSDIERAYYFGVMAQILGGNKSFKTTKKQFDEWFLNELTKPQSITRKEGLKYLKNRAYTDISGLGNKISGKYSQRILTANLQQQNILLDKVKKRSIEAYDKNKTKRWLASELRKDTQDWSRDFSRIADFVMQEAYAMGRAAQILEDFGDDAQVYKQTFPGVCKHCEKNYGSPGEEPIIYKLKDLIANGNNIGKKEQDPVVGPAHPWARSILHVVPKNSIWDKQKKEFVVQRNTSGIKRKSKVKIKIET
jgi:hypothetical protein